MDFEELETDSPEHEAQETPEQEQAEHNPGMPNVNAHPGGELSALESEKRQDTVQWQEDNNLSPHGNFDARTAAGKQCECQEECGNNHPSNRCITNLREGRTPTTDTLQALKAGDFPEEFTLDGGATLGDASDLRHKERCQNCTEGYQYHISDEHTCPGCYKAVPDVSGHLNRSPKCKSSIKIDAHREGVCDPATCKITDPETGEHFPGGKVPGEEEESRADYKHLYGVCDSGTCSLRDPDTGEHRPNHEAPYAHMPLPDDVLGDEEFSGMAPEDVEARRRAPKPEEKEPVLARVTFAPDFSAAVATLMTKNARVDGAVYKIGETEFIVQWFDGETTIEKQANYDVVVQGEDNMDKFYGHVEADGSYVVDGFYKDAQAEGNPAQPLGWAQGNPVDPNAHPGGELIAIEQAKRGDTAAWEDANINNGMDYNNPAQPAGWGVPQGYTGGPMHAEASVIGQVHISKTAKTVQGGTVYLDNGVRAVMGSVVADSPDEMLVTWDDGQQTVENKSDYELLIREASNPFLEFMGDINPFARSQGETAQDYAKQTEQGNLPKGMTLEQYTQQSNNQGELSNAAQATKALEEAPTEKEVTKAVTERIQDRNKGKGGPSKEQLQKRINERVDTRMENVQQKTQDKVKDILAQPEQGILDKINAGAPGLLQPNPWAANPALLGTGVVPAAVNALTQNQ